MSGLVRRGALISSEGVVGGGGAAVALASAVSEQSQGAAPSTERPPPSPVVVPGLSGCFGFSCPPPEVAPVHSKRCVFNRNLRGLFFSDGRSNGGAESGSDRHHFPPNTVLNVILPFSLLRTSTTKTEKPYFKCYMVAQCHYYVV